MLSRWFATPLWIRILGALALGILTGWLLGPAAASLKPVGDIFIASIQMLVVPLVFFLLVNGVAGLGDLGSLGRIGGRAVLIFTVTGLLAVALGMALGEALGPGVGLTLVPDGVPPPRTTAPQSIGEIVVGLVPRNPIGSMAEGNILQVIIFAILFGIGTVMAGEAGQPIARAAASGAAVMQKLTVIIMELAPFGVFALLAWVAGTFGLEALVPLAKLVGTLYLGCALFLGIVYPAVVRLIGGISVAQFYRSIGDTQAVAYSTASSAAALPITLRVLQERLRVPPSVAGFVASLGSTINMDGTGLYLGLVAVFGAQIFGIELEATDYLLVAVTATLGSIGAAGVPGAGLIMMVLVLQSIGVPLDTIAFVAGIDRIMDMMRTATNVTGDCATTVAVARWTGSLETSSDTAGRPAD